MKIKKILVSQPRPAGDKSPYFDISKKYDIEMVFRPFIKTEGLTAKEFRQSKISLADYGGVILTSRAAVDNFFRLCEEMRITIPVTMKYFCTSETVANYLQKYIVYRKRKIFASKTGKLADLVPSMVKHKTEKFLFAVSDVNNGADSTLLAENKLNCTPAVMYRTVSNDFTPEESFDYDMLIFFSPQGIDSLLKNFPNLEQGNLQIAAFGAATAKSVKDAGLRLDLEAPSPEAPSMTAALDLYLSRHNGEAAANA